MEKTMTFNDVFKKSFMDFGMASTLSVTDVAIILFLTFVIGFFIFYVYKKTYQGVLYSSSFNISLIVIAMVTAMVIIAVRSNVILSLGMVGALSIVRFRTAIKDPMDIVFMFWAIAVGITNGAISFKLSIVGSIMIATAIFVLSKWQTKNLPYLLIVNHRADGKSEVEKYVRKLSRYNIRSKIVSKDNVELTLEVRIKDDDTGFVDKISKLDGVKNALLVSYSGDKV